MDSQIGPEDLTSGIQQLLINLWSYRKTIYYYDRRLVLDTEEQEHRKTLLKTCDDRRNILRTYIEKFVTSFLESPGTVIFSITSAGRETEVYTSVSKDLILEKLKDFDIYTFKNSQRVVIMEGVNDGLEQIINIQAVGDSTHFRIQHSN